MKIKYADRADWKQIISRIFFVQKKSERDFKGVVSFLRIEKIEHALWMQHSNTSDKLCIVDDGYTWVQHFPSNELYVITTVLNEKSQVVQWYIDICKEHGITDTGIPWYKDLYLDIVFLPSGEVYILDEDELVEALKNKKITREDYDLAWKITNTIVKENKHKMIELLTTCKKHYFEIFSEYKTK